MGYQTANVSSCFRFINILTAKSAVRTTSKMPKAEKGTPKYLANKMKAKGLQKLRWYCQMCEKQCRDENGFKCHITSESHQRQLLIFADNSKRYLDQFSKEFSDGFVELLRRRFGTKRVFANQVYQEYISDRNHLHMNATKWLSLGEYVKWLGKNSICIVDETEKGWYITWIDRDPETIAKQVAGEKKEKMAKDDEERTLEFIRKQVEREKEKAPVQTEYTELKRENEDEKVVSTFQIKTAPKAPQANTSSALSALIDKGGKKAEKSSLRDTSSKKLSALELIRLEEEARKAKRAKYDQIREQDSKPATANNWLMDDIVVKVVTKDLGDKYYKQKGVVLQVDGFVAIVKLLETGSKLKLDQEHVETVIPNIGRMVKVLNGKYKGSAAKLIDLHQERFCVDVEIRDGPYKGKAVYDLPYEDVSKLHS